MTRKEKLCYVCDVCGGIGCAVCVVGLPFVVMYAISVS